MTNKIKFIRQTAAVLMACGFIASLLPGFAAAQNLSAQEAPGARAEAIVPLDGPVLAGKPANLLDSTGATTTVQPVLLIVDTDLQSDSDDAGALAVAHYLTNTGEAELIGVITSTVGSSVVAAADAINHYYGRPHIPVGLSVDLVNHTNDDYAPTLADTTQFPSNKTNATAPSSTALYRQLLYNAPRTVTIVVVGFHGPISALLDAPANYNGDGIPMTGLQLAAEKVEKLVLMAGSFDSGGGRLGGCYNVRPNAASLHSAATKEDTVNGAISLTAMDFRPTLAVESSCGRKTYAQANGFPPRCHRQF
jgi:hypothetical protein